MRLIVEEKGIPKKSVRVGKKKGYNSQDSQMKAYKWMFASQMRENGFKAYVKEPLQLTLSVYIPMPKKWSEERKNESRGQPWVTSRPDCSNLAKFYEDVLNRIAYEDDAHISRLISEKIWWDTSMVEINIKRLKDNETPKFPVGKGIC
jgi:Holliday junction resolvase RusA-like endonuclease